VGARGRHRPPARLTGIPGSERLTVTNSVVVGLSPPGGATHALLAVENNSIRFYDTGDTPSATNGLQLDPGTWYEIDLASLSAFKMIAIAGSAIVQVMYRRYGA
jgi:hypothetical protein